jgi:hypothetical protein
MTISIGQITAFLSLIGPLSTAAQSLAYLTHMAIATGTVSANQSMLIEEIAPDVYTPLYFQCNRFIHPQ